MDYYLHHLGLYVRSDTTDVGIIKEINRAYGWLNIKGKRVLDIGANIGAFSRFALDREASHVCSYEPDPENFLLLTRNAVGATMICAALVSTDEPFVDFYKTTSGKNPGNYSTVPFKGRTVITVNASNFNKILDAYKPQAIKMDCEGAEYDLMTCQLPDSVEEIAMEIHLNKKRWRKDLAPKLIALFDNWECVKKPLITDKNWHTVCGWRRKEASTIKPLKIGGFL